MKIVLIVKANRTLTLDLVFNASPVRKYYHLILLLLVPLGYGYNYMFHVIHYSFMGINPLFTLHLCHLVILLCLMTLSLVLFLIGILGFILNRKNIILMIISIELMLLAVTLLVLVSSYQFDDIMGQTYGIYIIAIAGAESAIGLGILVAYYRLRGNISLRT